MVKLEVCCYGIDCAVTAQEAGADRIELCAAPKEGGLTPSAGMLQAARSHL
ncbi:copper homeostasis protein CutC, partial [Mixta calida]